MKIAIVAIFALLGFWVVGAVLEAIQTKIGQAARSKSGTGSTSSRASAPPQADPIEEACRVLKLDRPFTHEELRAAYRQRMSQYHPDKVSSLGPEFQDLAERKSKEINRAFDLLARVRR